MKKKENLVLLGSTGSIGTQVLSVIDVTKDKNIYAISCNKNINLFLMQIKKYIPKYAIVYDEESFYILKNKIKNTNIKTTIFFGEDAMSNIISKKEVDIVVNALVGKAGINPTIIAIENKKKLAIANKECLCMEGKKIFNLAKKNNVELKPIDSEHSAIWQCLKGEKKDRVDKLIITCSGGPFYGCKKDDLKNVNLSDCLKHPTWHMGKKISVDSATLANKAFEVIEAHFLFDIAPKDIEVVIHRESIIHSMVLFKDGSIKAQLGVTSMRIPIAYALYENDRPFISEKTLDFNKLKTLHFDKPDVNTFVPLKYGYEALEKGKDFPKKFCLEDEIAVNDFINSNIKFIDIFDRLKKSIM